MEFPSLSSLPAHSGIYQFLNHKKEILYIGKAKNLRIRLSHYFHTHDQNSKIQWLLKEAAELKFILTATEPEALLLEQTLIKTHHPRFNVLLKDDKSYPFLYLSDHRFPRLSVYRGPQKNKGQYFGPYSKTGSMYTQLEIAQKIFKIRSCSDNTFKYRTRPCLQYQIKRCKAPCVNYVSETEYQADVKHTVSFLAGDQSMVVASLKKSMAAAVRNLQFEKAAEFRDQIRALKLLQKKQSVIQTTFRSKDADVFFIKKIEEQICITQLIFRDRKLQDSRHFNIEYPPQTTLEEALSAFLHQYYLAAEDSPSFIYTSVVCQDMEMLLHFLTMKKGKKVILQVPQRGQARAWMELAAINAAKKNDSLEHYRDHFKALQTLLHSPLPIRYLIGFDVSHTQGQATVASSVLFNRKGPSKKDYRRFNIRGLTPGDDYAALAQAVERRFTRFMPKEPGPIVLLIDGGRPQLRAVKNRVPSLNKLTQVYLIGIAKGLGRKPEFDKLYLLDAPKMKDLSACPLILLLLQSVRNEAHRFAVEGHRKQHLKKYTHSRLEDLPGIGPRRRQILLKHFGGHQALQQASLKEIAEIDGIGLNLANLIYNKLRDTKTFA